jgi:hypothetical protein
MNDGVFRSRSEPESDTQSELKADIQPHTFESDEEVPFTDYQKQHHHPFLVDHFNLGDSWADKFGGFKDEIDTIEGYFKSMIEKGEMKNEVDAVKEKFKEIYKLCKIDKTERITMQIEKLAAYIRFLIETDDIKLNHNKYAYS